MCSFWAKKCNFAPNSIQRQEMKYLLTLMMVFLAVQMCVHAQEPNSKLTISGHLTDRETDEPMELVTIQLFLASDSTFMGGTVSNEKGNFSIQAPSNGTYRLKISLVGYQKMEREVTLRNDRNQD